MRIVRASRIRAEESIQALYVRDSGPYPPHVRITAADAEGRFEFNRVPAGGYRIAVRPAGPAPDWQGMKRIDVTPAGVSEKELESELEIEPAQCHWPGRCYRDRLPPLCPGLREIPIPKRRPTLPSARFGRKAFG